MLLDGTGGAIGRALFERMSPGGRVVLFGWSSGQPFTFDVWDLYRLGVTVSCAIGARIADLAGRDAGPGDGRAGASPGCLP